MAVYRTAKCVFFFVNKYMILNVSNINIMSTAVIGVDDIFN